MKKQSLKLFASVLFLGIFTILVSASSAMAQDVLRFKVAFEFNAAGKQMTAGNYELKKMDASKYVLRNTETKEKAIVVFDYDTAQNNETESQNLVFNRYGESYFLRQIFVNRNQRGRETAESKQERVMRKGENETRLAKNVEKISVSSAQ